MLNWYAEAPMYNILILNTTLNVQFLQFGIINAFLWETDIYIYETGTMLLRGFGTTKIDKD